MMNKDNNIPEEKNNGITPKAAKEALECLPHNYVVQALKILDKWEKDGVTDKSYSKRYIIKVRKEEESAFNEDIMNALVEVGVKNKEVKEKFGLGIKKTPKTN